MKEYRSTTGGRYIFNEDMHNLQDLALSSAELFREGGVNFVISGCKITVTEDNDTKTVSVTAGYVYIDGKIRKVGAYSNTFNTINTIGIYVKNSEGPEIVYSGGTRYKQYDEYAAEVKVNDSNESELENIMATLPEGGGYVFPDLRTGFLSEYCLVNKGTKGQYSLITVDDIIAGTVNASVLEIDGTNINSLFLSLSGGVMQSGASIQFNGEETTIISELSITTGSILAGSIAATTGVFSDYVSALGFVADNQNGHYKFLKADGSLDDTDYLPTTGGTITGELTCRDTVLFEEAITCEEDSLFRKDLTCYQTIEGSVIKKTSGTSAQFLKADGTIDDTPYAPLTTLNNYLLLTGGTLTGLLRCENDITLLGELDIAREGKIDCGGDIECDGKIECDGNITCGQYIACKSSSGEIEAKVFKTTGGTEAQFVKGNGTLDGNTYVTTNAQGGANLETVLAGYLQLIGGVVTGNITANKFITQNGSSSQFVKGNGDLDSNKYVTTSKQGVVDLQTELDGYLPLTGGSLIRTGETSSIDLDPSSSTIVFNKSGQSASIYINEHTNNFVIQANGLEVNSGASFDGNVAITGGGNISISGNASFGGSITSSCLNIAGAVINITGDINSTKDIVANKFIKGDGTITGFLKADGMVDNSTYLTTSNAASTYLPLAGGTLTGALVDTNVNGITAKKFIVDGKTGYLKADGTVVDETYLTGIANSYITSAMLADRAITRSKIYDGAVGTVQLEDNCVDDEKLRDQAVYARHISNAAIENKHLSSLCVDEDNIRSGAITESKIGSSAVTGSKIAGGAITSVHLSAGSVVSQAIAQNAVTGNEIANNSIYLSHLIVNFGVTTTITVSNVDYIFENGILTQRRISAQPS